MDLSLLALACYLLLNTCTYVAVASSTHTARQCGGGIGSAVPWPAGRVMSYLRALKDGNDTETMKGKHRVTKPTRAQPTASNGTPITHGPRRAAAETPPAAARLAWKRLLLPFESNNHCKHDQSSQVQRSKSREQHQMTRIKATSPSIFEREI